jgi:hypothetical protein
VSFAACMSLEMARANEWALSHSATGAVRINGPPLLAMSNWLQWFQRLTMSEGTGPRSAERHCADADGDYRFSDDEEPQSRHKHEEAA